MFLASEIEQKWLPKTNGFVMIHWKQHNDFSNDITVKKFCISAAKTSCIIRHRCYSYHTHTHAHTHTHTHTHTPLWLTRPQSKLTQSELTINLILRLGSPSAASPEEVWGVGLLHEDLLQHTCGESRSRLSSQIKTEHVEQMQLIQLLTLWVFCAACAAGHSCRVGLWRHWVRGQKDMRALNEDTESWSPMLTSPWIMWIDHSYHHSCIRLTRKCKKHSDKRQEGCIRPGHLQLCVGLLRDTSTEVDQEGEVSKMYVREVGWEHWGILTALSEESEGVTIW